MRSWIARARLSCGVLGVGGLVVVGMSAGACRSHDDPGAGPSSELRDGGVGPGQGGPNGPGPGPGGPVGSGLPDAARPYVDFDVNHVLVTGQSNSTANDGTPVVTTTQPYQNLRFDTGPMSMKGGFSDPHDHGTPPTAQCDDEGCTTFEPPATLVPLVEGDAYFYPVETSASSFANEVSSLAIGKRGLPKHDVLVSIHGRSGTTYQCLRKGGCNYKPDYMVAFDQGMREVTAGKALATAAGKSYVVRAVLTIHGESDHYSFSSGTQEFPLNGTDGTAATTGTIVDYSDALLEWQRDYEAGVKAITAQTEPVPLFVSQLSGWTDVVESKVAQWQLDAHTKAPGKVVLVGPAYALSANQLDCLHFNADGERRLGEYFAKVYAHVVLGGEAWEPVRPKSVTLAGAVITVTFHVPKPPLVIDTTEVAAAPANGFTYADDSDAPPDVTKAEVVAPDKVAITLSAAPTGANKRIKYAMNQAVGLCIGTPTGARGNLRDSDDTPSKQGFPLQNWAVHFDAAVP